MQIHCKRCLEFGQDQESMNKTIEAYIASIDDAKKVSDKVYQMRVNRCEECSDLRNGVCKFCGCFCVVRAVKQNQYCPHPKGDKWKETVV